MKKQWMMIAAVLWFFAAASAFAQDAVQMDVAPKTLNIDAFYNGSSLTATGSAPADSHVILRFLGATCDLHMKERGKVFGLMWMNLDSLTFRGVPSVCLVSSAVDFDTITASKDSAQASGIKALRLSGIEDIAGIESKGIDRATAFNELLKLKQGEGLYRETVGNITYGPASDGKKSFKANIPIPSRLSPGAYTVELAAVRDGKIIAKAQEPITVKLIGFPALLSNLAFGHAALYGIFATIVALLAGLAIGMVFQSKGAH